MKPAEPGIRSTTDGGTLVLVPSGAWTLAHAVQLDRAMAEIAPAAHGPRARVVLDLVQVEALDTVGALLIAQLAERLRNEGSTVDVRGVQDRHAALLRAVAEANNAPRLPRQRRHPLLDLLERTGRGTVELFERGGQLLGFLGLVSLATARGLANPARVRLTSLAAHLEQTGVNALPILGLLSFLIGVVVAFQGAQQLKQFGAELLVVNLLAISVLRELGILLTAILVAGRSGSAYTAQIGTMVVNQEVDAMRTMGLDPVELLVLPRLGALVVALPLLAFYASIMALLGGALMCWAVLDIPFGQFLRQLRGAVNVTVVVVGLVKAPVFACAIGLVGCYQGLQVGGSAESVGRQTTRSVVESIFLVIVLDAIFAVAFQMMRI
ncbi:MAG TPA: MlaE family lipid ABC transporter permease subunit [Azospirillaceae bacterium]|nr:MlaE family lipid ABC transporter permease subunit [Azospirillaceae bacterium]